MSQSAERVGIVTGGAQGIGWGIAEALMPSLSALVIADKNEEAAAERAEELRRKNHRAYSCYVDVASEDSVTACAAWCRREVGIANVIVNNAGISGLRDGQKVAVVDHTLDEWNRSIGVNLTGVFLVSSAFAADMKACRWGRIINTASAAGRMHIPFAPGPYTAAKAAVMALTWTMADELGPYGITVNCVAPGRVETPMSSGLKRDQDSIQRIPLRRAGLPSDIGAAVNFLASDGAAYVTGATLDVSGGLYMS